MNKLPPRFEDLIKQSEVPVLVDFYADWCGPCHMVAPVVKQIASEYSGRLITIKINTDEKPQLAGMYQIQSIPTLIVFYKGKILRRTQGAMPYQTLKKEVDQALNLASVAGSKV